MDHHPLVMLQRPQHQQHQQQHVQVKHPALLPYMLLKHSIEQKKRQYKQ